MDGERGKALAAWRLLFSTPDTRLNVADRYTVLVRVAHKFQQEGLITPAEKKALILEATRQYSQAVQAIWVASRASNDQMSLLRT